MSTEPPAVPEATPEDVAALLTARTKDSDGNELGVWTEDTRPTREQVQARIDIARTLIRDDAGPIPPTCMEGAESTVALLASMLTEAAFWPEQTQSNQSTYERLRDIFLDAREGLQRCLDNTLGSATAYDLDTSGLDLGGVWPIDWWQRNLDRLMTRGHILEERRLEGVERDEARNAI
jgi:hypothetical protein